MQHADSFRAFCLRTLEDIISVQTACEILALLEELYEDEHIAVKEIMKKCYQYPIVCCSYLSRLHYSVKLSVVAFLPHN